MTEKIPKGTPVIFKGENGKGEIGIVGGDARSSFGKIAIYSGVGLKYKEVSTDRIIPISEIELKKWSEELPIVIDLWNFLTKALEETPTPKNKP